MSINVTVHGSPVRINRGKMVTCDADAEFERRRRIRLQQVRQQSKEIAANVRNRVRKEKEKQLTKSEQQGEKDLKRWQTRKLLTLQQQYRDCIKEVGSAHTRAALERDPAEVLTEIDEKNRNEANTRGKHARDKLHKDEIQRKKQETQPIEQKKLTRKIENNRSALVTKIDKIMHKNKKRKTAVDLTKMNNVLSDSGTCSDMENLSSPEKQNQSDSSCSPSISPKNVSIRSNFDSTLSEYTSDQSSPERSPRKRSKSLSKNKKARKSNKARKSAEHSDNSVVSKKSSKQNKKSEKRKGREKRNNRELSPDEIKQIIDDHRPLQLYSTNTQISDRIRQRKLPEIGSDNENNDFHFISNDISNPHQSPPKSNKFNIESYKICDIKSSKSKTDLPYVPTTSIRPDYAIAATSTTNAQVYDHSNRLMKEYSGATVQKISKDAIHVDPHSRNENDEHHEKMRKQDRDAHTRGVKAMEKVKIQKDYRQLLEDLPVLQKQERMAQIRKHNPKYHMDEERLREVERRRQTQIENIFDKYVHKCKNLETPLITIPPVQKSPPNDELKIPFRALDVTDSPTQLNVGEWTTNKVSANTSSRSDKTVKTSSCSESSETTDLVNKQKTLADLLQRVNNQRDLLLKEVSELPPSSNLNKILQDDELLKLICPCPQEEKAKQFVSTATSPLVIKSSKQKKKAKFKKNDTSPNTSTNSDFDQKKTKQSKSKTMLIKNSETQTSPIVPPNTPYSLSSRGPTENQEQPKNKICESPKVKMCEIIIKMAEETKIKIGTPENSKLITVEKSMKSSDVKPKSDPKPYHSTDISSSTTYMSPPDVPSAQFDSKSDKSKSYKDYLHNKPQQTNVETKKQISAQKATSNGKIINPQLMVYIKKLLSMSRQTIDDMAVSSVSEISTPGPSVLQTSANNSPLKQLHSVMNHYDLSFNDVQKYLSISETSVSYTENDTPPTPPIRQSDEKSPKTSKLKNVLDKLKISTKSRDKSRDSSPNSLEDQEVPRERSPSRQVPYNLIQRKISPTRPKKNKIAPDLSKPRELSPKSRISSPKSHTSAEVSYKTRYLFPTRDSIDKVNTSPPKLRDSSPKSRNSPHKSRDSPPKSRDSPPKSRDSPPKSRDSPPKPRVCDNICEAPCTKMLKDKKQDLLELQADIDQLVKESFKFDTKALSEQPYSAIFDRYAELTQTTCEKISNLTAMIDKVRLEKEKLLSPQSSEKNENSSTSYMELPPGLANANQQTGELASSSSSSISQDAVDQYLLSIGSPPKSPAKATAQTVANPEDLEPFIPMLQGIPKYIEDTQIACENVLNLLDPKVNQFLANNKPKPPPSLRRNNMNIDMVPHELSTILELDTVMSSRNVSDVITRRSKSPESKKTCIETEKNASKRNASTSDNSGFVTISPERYHSPTEQNDSKKTKKKSPKKIKKKPQNDIIQSDMSGVQLLSSDKSTSPEDMEVILRNLGLQWAVSTLKKTQEAMALSSSSSDTSVKKQVGLEKSSSGSEVSLKEVLSRQFLKKSLYMSDSSRSIDVADVSGHVVRSRDRSVQRTSTPLQHSRSSNSKNNDNLFTGDSDLSSVKLHNSDDMFLSIPNVSLDTNLSLNKSKK